MKKKFYNLWHLQEYRWCKAMHTYDPRTRSPFPFSKEKAIEYCIDLNRSWGFTLFEVREIKPTKPEKVIPDFPLDPTLHVLQAGYIQDRQRKRS